MGKQSASARAAWRADRKPTVAAGRGPGVQRGRQEVSLEPQYTIRTPQNVEFTFRLAGLGSRALAWLLDLLLMTVVIVLGAVAISALAGFPGGGEMVVAVFLLAVFVVVFGYGLFFEWRWNGQTPGKKILGLRVIKDDGTNIDFPTAVIRNFLRLVDSAPAGTYLVGATVAAVGERGKRIGDWAAGTLVVRVVSRRLPAGLLGTRGMYNTFGENPALAARIRRQVDVAERELLTDLVLRRDEIALEHRLRLFAEAAAYFQDRLGLERGEHMSDEKVIQNLAEVVLVREDSLL